MRGVGTMEVNKEEINEGSMFEHAAVDVSYLFSNEAIADVVRT
jgi:hypothetical protein